MYPVYKIAPQNVAKDLEGEIVVMKFWWALLLMALLILPVTALASGEAAASVRTLRFSWPVYKGAVQYRLVIYNGEDERALITRDSIYTNGVTVDASLLKDPLHDFYRVYAQDFRGNILGEAAAWSLVADEAEVNPAAPLPTTEFDKMDYTPLYPVYSWVPQVGAGSHEVEVYRHREGGDTLVRHLTAGEYDIYEDSGYTYPGEYYWRVRSLGVSSQDGAWSEPSYFTVEAGPVRFAALGDSITHGGGVISVPPGQIEYNWETYSPVPVKNLGFSGNTTGDMRARFESDVLPWAPSVLVIMGGVNDYRTGVSAEETLGNLYALKEKCLAHGITPVFVTTTPINPHLMLSRIAGIETPPEYWRSELQKINSWVMQQSYSVDITPFLTDGDGTLRADLTTDGLHPDYEGKKYIGEQIGEYLAQHF